VWTIRFARPSDFVANGQFLRQGLEPAAGPPDAWKSFSTNQTILCFTTPIVRRAAAQFDDCAWSAGFFRGCIAVFGSTRAEGKSGLRAICAAHGTSATV
jgi:hypothetical protein